VRHLCRVLTSDPLDSALASSSPLRAPIPARPADEASGRAGPVRAGAVGTGGLSVLAAIDALLARDFNRFEDALADLATGGFVCAGGA